jgi:hypothetical protein
MPRLLNSPAQTILLSILLAVGAALPAAAQSGEGKAMMLQMKNFAPVPAGLGELKVALGVIPGRLTGNPVEISRFLIPAVVGQEFTVPLDAVARAVAADAKAAEPDTLKDGLVVKPAATRFLRLSTFVVHSESGEIAMGGSLKRQDGNFVMLTYFDRACSLHGVDASRGSVREINLEIPAAGLYWLHVETITPDVYRMTLEDPAAVLQFEASR